MLEGSHAAEFLRKDTPVSTASSNMNTCCGRISKEFFHLILAFSVAIVIIGFCMTLLVLHGIDQAIPWTMIGVVVGWFAPRPGEARWSPPPVRV